MKMLLESLPSADEPPRGNPSKRGDIWFASAGITRRRFVQAAGATATGIGLAALGLLPTAKKAYASHAGTDGYQIKELPCPSYASSHNCSSDAPYHGCGDSTVYSAACVENSTYHTYGWHKGSACEWILRKDDCTSSGHDGWKWDPGNCGLCCPVVYRCHDGYKRGLQYCNILDRSICRHVVSCGNC